MFHHLHGHSMFSNHLSPDALSSPEELVARAKAIGLPSLALTDHASVMGIPHFVKACADAGIKPHVGAELYVVDDPAKRPAEGETRRKDYVHVVALAMNFEGFQEIMELLTIANSDPGFYYKPRSAFDDLYKTKNVIFTTACAGGVLSRDDYMDVLVKFKAAVGPERLYLEVQPHNDTSQAKINQRAVAASTALGLKLVAAQDFHYANPGDNVTHEVLLAIGSKDVWSNPSRWRYPVDDLYIKSAEEMVAAFKPHVDGGIMTAGQVAEAIMNTNQVAAAIDLKWRTLPISLPDMGADPDIQILKICAEELKRRGFDTKPEYVNRVIYEIDVLKKSGFISYFLTLRDIIAWSRDQGIAVGPGRGSSGGSLVCYLLGITQVDPIYHGLLFERFFRPGRIDLPDIDTDFEDERRDEVLAYIRRRYGEDFVANVASYTMLGAKGAIKDVARVFELDHKVINDVTAPIDNKLDDADVFDQPAVKSLFASYPHVGYHAQKLTGWMRGTGQHAAGVVIAGDPLWKHAVVNRRDGRSIVCWDKNIIENMGLMKLDVLGLRTLSILRIAAENVRSRRGKRVDYEDIPLDDAKTLEIFQRGDTTGVFQFESRGMRALLKSLKIETFSTIADANALYRPGPMDLIPQYEACQTGRTPPSYTHPLMEPILAETHGVMIYQEQLMRCFVDVGGFDYAHADKMRKIVSKSMGADEFSKHEGDFLAGALAKGLPEPTAKKIFSDMIKFGGYGFNKSHAVAYSIIAYWCAYMKAHYPAEFYAAHLSNSDEDQSASAIDDALKAGIEVVMPNVVFSDVRRFEVLTDRKILAPLTAIKGVGEKAAELIVGARTGKLDHNGLGPFDMRETKTGVQTFDKTYVRPDPFRDHADFLQRVYKRVVNTKVQRLLQEAGALPWDMPDEEALAASRRDLLGHVYREITLIESEDFMQWDEVAQTNIAACMTEIHKLCEEAHATRVYPNFGSKPRIMMVFDKPEWKDERKGMMGNGDGYEVVRQMLKDELKLTLKDFYLTSYYKLRTAPLGLDPYEDRSAMILRREIEVTQPPLIIAFGKKPIEFFAGAGAKVNDSHGKIIRYGKLPVLLSISPIQVVMEPDKRTKFLDLAETLKGIIV